MFSGIEGFGLGFELAGWPVETLWQSEVDPFCLEVLALRYPRVKQLGDIREAREFPAVDLLTAGFPCQPVSQAGRGLAQDDPRWLWPQVERVIAAVRPQLVICENVRGLRSRGLSIVLHDLARIGYDAQWDLLPAAANGAPHLRHRFWIVAYPHDAGQGRIFKSRPPVFPWASEEPAKPRLLRNVHRRRDRLAALGNAVVPYAVAGVALTIGASDPEWGDDAWMVGGSNAKTIDSFDGKPPYSGALIGGKVFPLPTSAPKLKERLWPTATADDAEWSLEAIMRCVDKHGQPARDPHVRHYHPETGQIVQRTLTNYVRGAEAGLWPTPVASDAMGSRKATARTDEWTSQPGYTLLDAVWLEEGVDHHAVHGSRGATGSLLFPTPLAADGERTTEYHKRGNPTLLGEARTQDELDRLWPTAAASDHKGISQPGQRRGQLEEAVRGQERLWPTPNAADGNGKGARHNPGTQPDGSWRQVNLVDAVVQEARELWPTPNAADAAGGRTTAGNREGGPPLAAAVHAAASDPGGSLNPRWVEWLMGYPAGWTTVEFVPAAAEEAA